MFEFSPELFNQILSEYAQLFISLVIFAFIYAGLGRSKVFQDEKVARGIIAMVLGLYSASLVQAQYWHQILQVCAGAFTAGLIAMILYHIAFQRGKVRRETEIEEVEG